MAKPVGEDERRDAGASITKKDDTSLMEKSNVKSAVALHKEEKEAVDLRRGNSKEAERMGQLPQGLDINTDTGPEHETLRPDAAASREQVEVPRETGNGNRDSNIRRKTTVSRYGRTSRAPNRLNL